MTTWKSLNVAVGAVAFAAPVLLGVLVQLVWMGRSVSAGDPDLGAGADRADPVAVLVELPCWATGPAGVASPGVAARCGERGRRVGDGGFWSASVGWRLTAGAGLLTVISEVIRVAALGHQGAAMEVSR